MGTYLYNLAIELVDEITCMGYYTEAENIEIRKKIADLANEIIKTVGLCTGNEKLPE